MKLEQVLVGIKVIKELHMKYINHGLDLPLFCKTAGNSAIVIFDVFYPQPVPQNMMARFSILTIPIVYFFLLPGFTHAWSGEAHRVIARIASQFLRESGKYFLAEHLTGRDATAVEKSLMEHSMFADSVEWSTDLHFSHTPYRGCAPFEMDRDCPLVGGARRCIVTAISNYTIRASDIELSVEERAEAIKFLIHLMGDIHNPLHVGFAEDRGGTQIHLSEPLGETLHSVWDDVLVYRKQVEVGVIDELGEMEESKPWLLSDALLRDLMKSHAYMLNIGLESVSNLEAATNLAAEMASEIALQFTCNAAYRDEQHLWIEDRGSLDEAYLASRTEISMELLKVAGVRLAELLNIIGKVYATRKFEKTETSFSLEPPIEDMNRFIALDFDFDPEELLFDESSAVVTVPMDNEDEKEDMDTVDLKGGEAREARKVLSKSKKARMRKARMKLLMDSVVLIKRNGQYIVTGSHLVTPNYFPFHQVRYQVRFANSRDVFMFFDSEHFGSRHIEDKKVIEGALMKIRKLPLVEEFKSDCPSLESPAMSGGVSFESCLPQLAPFDGEVRVGKNQVIFSSQPLPEGSSFFNSKAAKKKADLLRKKRSKEWEEVLGHVPSKEEILELELRRNIDNICHEKFGPYALFVHINSLQDTSVPMMKVNQFAISGATRGSAMYLMIDNKIFDGPLTVAITNMLAAPLKKDCAKLFDKRPTLNEELMDIFTFQFGQSKDRVKSVMKLKYFTYFDVEGEHFHRIHWSIHSENTQSSIL